MTKTHRDLLKRQLAQIYFHLEHAMEGLLEMKETFDPHHPPLGEFLGAMAEGILLCQDMCNTFWKEAWGQDAPRWESWL